jgi:succinyl-CoA synthetase beta subunit
MEKSGSRDFVVKAQVLAGGRGKGTFKSGFKGGVHIANSTLEVRSLAAKMLNQQLVTKQTGAEGKPCHKVVITERLYLRRETYFAILMDRASGGPVMVASPAGGMDIETVAAQTPNLIFKEPINITTGPRPDQLERLSRSMGFNDADTPKVTELLGNLYKLFRAKDCTQVEINPLGETHDGRVMCIDAKLNFDPNSEYRQKEVFGLRDTSQEDQREVSAEKAGLNYIGLDGDIGCLVNGAGLAMATMDIIKLHGGAPANFLDLGGGASASQVTEAFKLLNQDKQVRAILVNIFGGIMKCDVIALGLINAAQQLGLKKPIVVRLMGTNVAEAKKLIDNSGFRMLVADDLGEAAERVSAVCVNVCITN